MRDQDIPADIPGPQYINCAAVDEASLVARVTRFRLVIDNSLSMCSRGNADEFEELLDISLDGFAVFIEAIRMLVGRGPGRHCPVWLNRTRSVSVHGARGWEPALQVTVAPSRAIRPPISPYGNLRPPYVAIGGLGKT